MSLTFDFAARSDVGLVRKSNQDSGYAGPHLLVLADGMGGPAGGDIASSIAVAHLSTLDADAHPADDLLDLLRSHVGAAHDELVSRSHCDAALHGLGTTVIAILRSGNKMAMIHVGDSRAYLLRREHLTQVTTDHSFVQYLIDTGQLTPEQAENHPQRSVVMRILGDSPEDVVLDESLREGIEGDRWLLCSDGLSGVVSVETIQEVLAKGDSPDETCEQLIELALRAGAPDNVTCVVADVVQPSPKVALTPQIVGAAATDRLAKTRGTNSAAGRAAALRDDDVTVVVDEEDPVEIAAQRKKRKRRILTRFIITMVAITTIIGASWAGWTWTQKQYYVQITDGRVWIHRGIPQSVGPWHLHSRYKNTGIAETDLPYFQRQKVTEPITKSSLTEAEAVVENLRRESEQYTKMRIEPAPIVSDSPAATPNPSPATSNSPAKAG